MYNHRLYLGLPTVVTVVSRSKRLIGRNLLWKGWRWQVRNGYTIHIWKNDGALMLLRRLSTLYGGVA